MEDVKDENIRTSTELVINGEEQAKMYISNHKHLRLNNSNGGIVVVVIDFEGTQTEFPIDYKALKEIEYYIKAGIVNNKNKNNNENRKTTK